MSAAIALGATGCFSDRGVAIEVNVGDTKATFVELYVGRDACNDSDQTAIDCTGIAPPETPRVLPGNVWFRDTAERYTAKVTGRTATFRLQADSTTVLPIVIAVGSVLSDNGLRPVGTATMLDLEVPAHDARIATAKLARANLVGAPAADPQMLEEDRVAAWTNPTETTACVAVERWSKNQPPTRRFIVPGDDPDCDGLTTTECNPAAYLGASSSGGKEPDCATQSDGSACVLGNLACTDKTGPGVETCAHTAAQICVPDAFCECPGLDEQCLQLAFANLEKPLPFVDCKVPMTADGKPCADDADRKGELDLKTHFATTACGPDPKLGDLLGNFDTSHAFGGATIEVNRIKEPCNLLLKWTGGERTATELTVERGAIALGTSDGRVIVPLVLTFAPETCGLPFSCMLIDNTADRMWTCTQ